MLYLFVADVGDGLAAGIRTVCGSRIQIDCGSQQGPDACRHATERFYPKAFILSHFHADHYNGLFQVESRSLSISEVFLPRLPQFDDREEFLYATFAMARRTLGDISGLPEADFLSLISSISGVQGAYQFLSAGEQINIDGSCFEVLWPPRTLDDNTALKKVKRALKDFDTALQEDDKLKRLHDKVQKSTIVKDYLIGERRAFKPIQPERQSASALEPTELPEATKKANQSLRAAANHMSLAFYEDNRFLFPGDLEEHEISEVANNLAEKGRTHFLATIAPHHGTHWHNDLGRIETEYVVSSVGKQLIQKIRPELKSFGRRCLATYSNGDIFLPNCLDWDHFDPRFCFYCRKPF